MAEFGLPPGTPLAVIEQYPVLPPPNGTQSNFVNPVDNKANILILAVLGLFLVTSFTILRLYTRHFITHKLSWDDRMLVYFCSHRLLIY